MSRTPPPSRALSPRAVGAGVLAIDLPLPPSPGEALDRLEGLPGRILLESSGPEGTFSLLVADPIEVMRSSDSVPSDPFDGLAECLARLRMPIPPQGVHFAGGVIGYLAYEAGDVLERLPPPAQRDLDLPDAYFGVYDGAIQWDRSRERCTAVASILPGRSESETAERLRVLAERVVTAPLPGQRGADEVSSSGLAHSRRDSPSGAPEHSEPPHSSLTREEFQEGVERIRRFIRAGDLFQANLTRRITVRTGLSGTELYRALVAESPAPYSAFLDLGGAQVASISPELFLSVRGASVETAPIKGTLPRGADAEEDAMLRARLRSSSKDRAENVMIVDLLRNDLSRVCLPGTIGVPTLAEVETHPTVHHLVSRVIGTLRPELGVVELLRATFPGGSITGAPKIRAMEILRELEPIRRGVYTGAIGILGFHGDVELSIAIRTAVLEGGRAHYGTGGGITLGSDPEAEWEETEDKAEAFLRALRRTGR